MVPRAAEDRMLDLLPDHFERDLVHNVQLIAQNALANADSGSNLGSLVDAFQCVFDRALTSVLRVYNSKHSRQHRLPNELWCIVWGFLPLRSVLSVTHVCQLWRSLAISCPRLWCTLKFWSSIHSKQCACNDCFRRPGHGLGLMPSTGISNLDEVVALIPRSNPLPLTVHISVSAKSADLNVVGRLAHSLAPHSHRIKDIHFHSAGSMVPLVFFPCFEELPRLVSLVVESPQDDSEGGFPLLPGAKSTRRLLLPSLRHMSLTAGIGIHPQLTKSLRSLRLPYDSANHVLAYIQQTPNLQLLCLRLPHHRPRTQGTQNYAALKAACIRVPRVIVTHVGPAVIDQHAMHLLDSRYRELTFSYAGAYDYEGLCVLATVLRPEWFRLVRRREDTSERLVFALGDGRHTRTLSLPYSACNADPGLTAAWDAYPAQLHAPTATVDLALLPRVPLRVAAMVSALVVEMPALAAGPLPFGVPAFPALETVEFRMDRLDPPAHYSETRIFNVAQLLRRGKDRKLQTVIIADVLLVNDSLLSSIADDVVHVARRS